MIQNFLQLFLRAEFLRYFAVSLCALIVDLGCFSFLFRLVGLNWVIAATCGFVLGSITAYVLSVRFVFHSRVMARMPAAEFVFFAVIGLFGLTVTQVILWLGIDVLQANAELSKLGSSVMTFISNYVLRKFFLFRKRKEESPFGYQTHAKNVS